MFQQKIHDLSMSFALQIEKVHNDFLNKYIDIGQLPNKLQLISDLKLTFDIFEVLIFEFASDLEQIQLSILAKAFKKINISLLSLIKIILKFQTHPLNQIQIDSYQNVLNSEEMCRMKFKQIQREKYYLDQQLLQLNKMNEIPIEEIEDKKIDYDNIKSSEVVTLLTKLKQELPKYSFYLKNLSSKRKSLIFKQQQQLQYFTDKFSKFNIILQQFRNYLINDIKLRCQKCLAKISFQQKQILKQHYLNYIKNKDAQIAELREYKEMGKKKGHLRQVIYLRQRIVRIKIQNDSLKEISKEQRAALIQLEKEVKEMKQQLIERNNQIEEINKILAERIKNCKEFQKSEQKLKEDLQEKQSENFKLKQNNIKNFKENQEIKYQNMMLKQNVTKLQHKIMQLEEQNTSLNSSIKFLQSKKQINKQNHPELKQSLISSIEQKNYRNEDQNQKKTLRQNLQRQQKKIQTFQFEQLEKQIGLQKQQKKSEVDLRIVDIQLVKQNNIKKMKNRTNLLQLIREDEKYKISTFSKKGKKEQNKIEKQSSKKVLTQDSNNDQTQQNQKKEKKQQQFIQVKLKQESLQILQKKYTQRIENQKQKYLKKCQIILIKQLNKIKDHKLKTLSSIVFNLILKNINQDIINTQQLQTYLEVLKIKQIQSRNISSKMYQENIQTTRNQNNSIKKIRSYNSINKQTDQVITKNKDKFRQRLSIRKTTFNKNSVLKFKYKNNLDFNLQDLKLLFLRKEIAQNYQLLQLPKQSFLKYPLKIQLIQLNKNSNNQDKSKKDQEFFHIKPKDQNCDIEINNLFLYVLKMKTSNPKLYNKVICFLIKPIIAININIYNQIFNELNISYSGFYRIYKRIQSIHNQNCKQCNHILQFFQKLGYRKIAKVEKQL